ncbi:TPA: hypothetical protein ACSPZ8_004010 [Aeromonas hydrophila]
MNSDSGICEHHFRKVCGQGFFEQKLSFEGRHLFDSPNKPAAKRSAAVVDPRRWNRTVHLTSEYVLCGVWNRCTRKPESAFILNRNRCSFSTGICSFSQAAVAEAMCAHSGLAKLVSQLLMLPGFAYAHDVEGRRIGGPLVAPNPVLHKTTFFVSPRDMREHLPREINFARFRSACNASGQPVGEWQRVIVGAYVNHGSNNAPDWGSHT